MLINNTQNRDLDFQLIFFFIYGLSRHILFCLFFTWLSLLIKTIAPYMSIGKILSLIAFLNICQWRLKAWKFTGPFQSWPSTRQYKNSDLSPFQNGQQFSCCKTEADVSKSKRNRWQFFHAIFPMFCWVFYLYLYFFSEFFFAFLVEFC